jgi:hypothetical protein
LGPVDLDNVDIGVIWRETVKYLHESSPRQSTLVRTEGDDDLLGLVDDDDVQEPLS